MHLLYLKAFDLRLQLLISSLGWQVSPASSLASLERSYRAGDCVVVDVEDELDAGAHLVETLAARLERPLLIALSAEGSLEFFRRCFKAGAVDVLDKSIVATDRGRPPRAHPGKAGGQERRADGRRIWRVCGAVCVKPPLAERR